MPFQDYMHIAGAAVGLAVIVAALTMAGLSVWYRITDHRYKVRRRQRIAS